MQTVGDASKARLIAAFIDNLIGLAFMLIVVGVMPEDFSTARAILIPTGYLGYFILSEALWSRTLGKYLQGLVVRKIDGSRCDWKASLIRNVFRVIEVNRRC